MRYHFSEENSDPLQSLSPLHRCRVHCGFHFTEMHRCTVTKRLIERELMEQEIVRESLICSRTPFYPPPLDHYNQVLSEKKSPRAFTTHPLLKPFLLHNGL